MNLYFKLWTHGPPTQKCSVEPIIFLKNKLKEKIAGRRIIIITFFKLSKIVIALRLVSIMNVNVRYNEWM
jgi:hypothetical protein